MGILTDGDRRARDETIGANRIRPGKSDQLPPFSLFGIRDRSPGWLWIAFSGIFRSTGKPAKTLPRLNSGNCSDLRGNEQPSAFQEGV